MKVYLKTYLTNIMNDKEKGVISSVVSALLFVISVFYGLVINIHELLYDNDIMKSHKVGIPVISVGNITLGGTGKTPFVIMLARLLAGKKKKVSVLIRGYGEDEWKLLHDKLGESGIKIYVGRDRVKNAEIAEKEGADIIILDDGFQHRRLKRDYNIALVDSSNPFGNGSIFPRGVLREPIKSLKRANFIVLTKADKGVQNIDNILKEVKKYSPNSKILQATHAPKGVLDITGKKKESLSLIKGKTVCLVSAICDSSYFRYVTENAGANIKKEFIFPDHHAYTDDDFNMIFDECLKSGIDTMLTTEKDAVKIAHLKLKPNNIRSLVLEVSINITRGEEFLNALYN